jgi:hypothetical protein
MTGVKANNFHEFNRVAAILRNSGYEVINPADHGCSESLSWSDYMRMDIADLIECDLIATLDGWELSKGARLEVHIAKELGMDVLDYRELINK